MSPSPGRSPSFLAMALALALVPAAGCGDAPSTPAPGTPGAAPATAAPGASPHAPGTMPGLPAGHPPVDGLPAGHPPVDGIPATPPPAEPTWTFRLPGGWEQREASGYRLFDFRMAERPGVECWATVLAGDGGGLLENINRWHEQMGRPPVDAAAVDALPKVPMMGGTVPLVEVTGPYRGMDGELRGDHMLLGVARLLGTHSVFVKMTGPVDAVKAEKGKFLEFCASLEEHP